MTFLWLFRQTWHPVQSKSNTTPVRYLFFVSIQLLGILADTLCCLRPFDSSFEFILTLFIGFKDLLPRLATLSVNLAHLFLSHPGEGFTGLLCVFPASQFKDVNCEIFWCH